MARIPQSIRDQVFDRAQNRCEYCQTRGDVVISLEVEHIFPSSRGGTDDLDNLCAACITCNDAKAIHTTGIDSKTNQEVRLFNPREQIWSEHFSWSEDNIFAVGLTAVGRATIRRLKMNSPKVISSRRLWVTVGLHPPF